VPKFIVRLVVLPDVEVLAVRIPTLQVTLTDPVGKLLQEKEEGSEAVMVVTALELFMLRMTLCGLLTTREIELLVS
jgi:hypothetical protein